MSVAEMAATRPAANPPLSGERTKKATGNLILALMGVLFALPMLWLLVASVDSQASWAIEWPHFTLAHFGDALSSGSLRSLYNSMIIAVVSTAIATVTGAFAAYALSRRAIPFKGPLLLIVLFLSGVPLAILVIPVFEIFARLGWLSIIPCSVFVAVTSLPFEIYLMKNFIDAIPHELEEAARMEGASTVQVLRRVIGPLALPGIGAAAIFGFVNAWGQFIAPLVLISDPNQQPGAIAIFGYIGAANVRYGDIAAFSLVYAIPVFVLYAMSSRLFRGGFVLGGAVKG